ncbi:MAG: GldG family protein, partial [Verrucomicrobia bacterium]|nr:GldG family protein [Verrucomicrobiota bacterium]
MNKKQTDLFLYSSVGVIIMLVMVVLVNVISGHLKTRIDLTSEKLYTLSEGTKQILGELDTDVEIRFYATRDEKVMPPNFKNYISHIEDILDEYSQYAGGHLSIKKFNPEPDSDAADLANLDGVTGQALSFDDRIYLGLAISMLDKTVALPFLDPTREKLLEYDLTRAITQVTVDDKPVVGVMSALPVFGQQPNPMMAQMGQAPPQQPAWFIIDQLQQDFEVRELQLTADSIDADLDLLVVIHPKDITDATQYAIDQFLLGGGQLIAFLDAMAIVDQTPSPQGNNMLGPPPSTSNMEKLLKAWGLEFETTKIAADRLFAREISFQRGAPPQIQPGILFMDPNGISSDDVITSQIDQLLIPFPGVFKGTAVDGLEQSVLLHTSKESQLVDAFMARLSGQNIMKEFKSDDKEYPLAIRLNGTFKTAFPDGKPLAVDAPVEDDLDKEDSEIKPESPSLTESKDGASVVLFGDADFIYDNFSVQRQNFLGA